MENIIPQPNDLHADIENAKAVEDVTQSSNLFLSVLNNAESLDQEHLVDILSLVTKSAPKPQDLKHTELQQKIVEMTDLVINPYDREKIRESLDRYGYVSSNHAVKIIDVDRQTFNALLLAQAVIGRVRSNLVYGSLNLESDWYKTREGKPQNLDLSRRLNKVRSYRSDKLSHEKHGLTINELIGVKSALAEYYGAGQCGEHSASVFTNTALLGYPGLLIKRVKSTIKDHVFNLFFWEENGALCKNPVVCDPWRESQACRWDEFAENFGENSYDTKNWHYINHNDRILDQQILEIIKEKTIGEQIAASLKTLSVKGMGSDFAGEALDKISSGPVSKIFPQSKIRSPGRFASALIKMDARVIRESSNLKQEFNPFVEYRHKIDPDSGVNSTDRPLYKYLYLSQYTRPVKGANVLSDDDREHFTAKPNPLIVDKGAKNKIIPTLTTERRFGAGDVGLKKYYERRNSPER